MMFSFFVMIVDREFTYDQNGFNNARARHDGAAVQPPRRCFRAADRARHVQSRCAAARHVHLPPLSVREARTARTGAAWPRLYRGGSASSPSARTMRRPIRTMRRPSLQSHGRRTGFHVSVLLRRIVRMWREPTPRRARPISFSSIAVAVWCTEDRWMTVARAATSP